MMPASRLQEIKYILPTFMKVANKLQKKYPKLVVFIPSCRDTFEKKFAKALKKYKVNGRIVSAKDIEANKPFIYSLSKLALCKSGTVNMELALYGVPQVVGYKVSRVTAFIAKKILKFKVKFISPVNLLMRKLIIPEFVQKDFEVNRIFKKSSQIMDKQNQRIKINDGYKSLKKTLGDKGVVQRAACEILDSLILS